MSLHLEGMVRMKGEFRSPYCITYCVNGFVHVRDWYNNRVQIF